jgi:hypothetical protein
MSRRTVWCSRTLQLAQRALDQLWGSMFGLLFGQRSMTVRLCLLDGRAIARLWPDQLLIKTMPGWVYGEYEDYFEPPVLRCQPTEDMYEHRHNRTWVGEENWDTAAHITMARGKSVNTHYTRRDAYLWLAQLPAHRRVASAGVHRPRCLCRLTSYRPVSATAHRRDAARRPELRLPRLARRVPPVVETEEEAGCDGAEGSEGLGPAEPAVPSAAQRPCIRVGRRVKPLQPELTPFRLHYRAGDKLAHECTVENNWSVYLATCGPKQTNIETAATRPFTSMLPSSRWPGSLLPSARPASPFSPS